jgi:threonine dehydratase
MGLDCSTTRKPILNSVPFHILKDIKKRYPSASALMKSELSPVINTPMLKIKDKIYLKLESHQTSGSFKIRGAFLYF